MVVDGVRGMFVRGNFALFGMLSAMEMVSASVGQPVDVRAVDRGVRLLARSPDMVVVQEAVQRHQQLLQQITNDRQHRQARLADGTPTGVWGAGWLAGHDCGILARTRRFPKDS